MTKKELNEIYSSPDSFSLILRILNRSGAVNQTNRGKVLRLAKKLDKILIHYYDVSTDKE